MLVGDEEALFGGWCGGLKDGWRDEMMGCGAREVRGLWAEAVEP
jgi:hypothetical protein